MRELDDAVDVRRDRARALRRLVGAGWRLDGASDHLVSEALYLSDPDGLGIEVYADRPRSTWKTRGDELQMTSDPLDIRSVVNGTLRMIPRWDGSMSWWKKKAIRKFFIW